MPGIMYGICMDSMIVFRSDVRIADTGLRTENATLVYSDGFKHHDGQHGKVADRNLGDTVEGHFQQGQNAFSLIY